MIAMASTNVEKSYKPLRLSFQAMDSCQEKWVADINTLNETLLMDMVTFLEYWLAISLDSPLLR